MKTFSRGIHFENYRKDSQNEPIRELPSPHRVILPLQQNLGCPGEPLVKVLDQVAEGQKLSEASRMVFAPIHASISGKVVKIEKLPNPCGFDVAAIVIEQEPESASLKSKATSHKPLEEFSPEEIRKIVREAGIVGLGGAAFPTHVKLNPPKDKKIDTIIVNGCECEPYITADHRMMIERAEDIIFGARAVLKACDAQNIIIGIEENKKDAALKFANSIRVELVKTKYPQGGEKMLIKALLNREVPSGGLPLDVGVVVQNVGTCAAIAEAVKHGTPLTKRVVTVAGGGVKEPQNVLVRIGTTFREVIEHCGGLSENPVKVLMGGPMMGIAVSTLDVPVVKATTCILVLNKKEAKMYEEQDCIRCGRCVKACPTGLMPNFLANFTKLKDWDQAEDYNIMDCIECGCCAYVCPSRINLVQYFKVAKSEALKRAVKLPKSEEKKVCP